MKFNILREEALLPRGTTRSILVTTHNFVVTAGGTPKEFPESVIFVSTFSDIEIERERSLQSRAGRHRSECAQHFRLFLVGQQKQRVFGAITFTKEDLSDAGAHMTALFSKVGTKF